MAVRPLWDAGQLGCHSGVMNGFLLGNEAEGVSSCPDRGSEGGGPLWKSVPSSANDTQMCCHVLTYAELQRDVEPGERSRG